MRRARKIALWIGVLSIGCPLLLVGTAAALMRTEFAHRYILRLVTAAIQGRVGGEVEIGGVSFHATQLGADLYRITISGKSANSNTPLFSADRAEINFGVHLFRRRKLTVDDFTLDHPVVHLTFDEKGNSNLPNISNTTSGSSENLFDLAIGHLVLNAGEIFYNDRRIPVSADVRDLDANAVYDGLSRSYAGTLSYYGSRVSYGGLAPFTHDLQVSLGANSSGITLKPLFLRSGSSWIKAQGQLADYANPSVNGSYQASLATGELAKIVMSASTSTNHSMASIAGRIDSGGAFSYQSKTNKPAINSVSINGNFGAGALGLNLPEARVKVQNVKGDYGIQQGSLEVSNFAADTLGGHITAHLLVRQLETADIAELNGEAQNVSIAAIREAMPMRNLAQVRINASASGDVRANWRGKFRNLQLLSNASAAGSVAPVPNAGSSAGSFPIKAAVHVEYNGPKQVVTFHGSSVDTANTHLSVDGTLGTNANVQVQGRSDDLSEIDMLMLAFWPGTPSSDKKGPSSPQLLGLGGTATFRSSLSGTLANPKGAGEFSATNLKVSGSTVQSLQAEFQASSAGVAIRQGIIRSSAQSQATFDLSVGLQDWSFTPQQPIMVRLNASKMPVTDLERITGLQYPINGLLAANLSIDGTEENPRAQGNIHLTQGRLWQQPFQAIDVDLKNSGDTLQTQVDLRTSAGSATGTITYVPKTRDYDLQASLRGIRLNQVQYLQTHAHQVTGIISASAQGHGNLRNPQLEMTVEGQQLKIGDQAIEGFMAQASLSQLRAAFRFGCTISGAALQSQGTVNLTGAYQANATIDSDVIHLDSMLASFLPEGASDFHGQTQIHGTLAGPLKDPHQLEVHLELPSLSMGYDKLDLAAASPIHLDFKGDVLAVERAEFKGTGTDVTVVASVHTDSVSSLRATATGAIDLRLLQLWNPQWVTSGQATLNIGAQGVSPHPELSGTIAVSNGSIAVDNAPSLEKVTGELDISGERVQVKSLTGQLGGGDFEVHGFATYQPSIQYNLGMTAKDVRLLYPEGVRTQLTANLNFVGGPANANLTGQVSVDRLSLTQSFDLATFSNALGGPSSPPGGMAQNVNLNIAVSSTQELEVSSSQLSIQGTADFRVRGTVAEPVLIGRTQLTGGELFFNGRRFQIQNASIQFANPVRIDPVLNLTATTTVNQFDLTVNLVGPFDRLRTTYASDPPLAPVDVINLLISGQTTEAAAGSTTSPQSVIAGQLTGQVSNRLQKLTGISSLTIDPQIGGNQGNAASQLAIQERVTKNLFFTFATDVTTTQGVIVQVEYQVTPKFTMSAVRDQTGGYEIEIKSHKKF